MQVDGLETVLADVFGPEGAFPDNTVFQMFNFTLTKEKFEEWTKKRNERDEAEVNILLCIAKFPSSIPSQARHAQASPNF